jgi:urea transporter
MAIEDRNFISSKTTTYPKLLQCSKCVLSLWIQQKWWVKYIIANASGIGVINVNFARGTNFAIKFAYKLIDFIIACLRGSGQVVFMNNPWSGLLIIVGLLIQSAWIGSMGKHIIAKLHL